MEDSGQPNLGQVLRARREQFGLSQYGLENLSGVDHSVIGRIESGHIAAPAPDKLTRLAEALRLNVADVFILAGYSVPRQLPSFRPYLRSRYGDLPPEAHERLDAYFQLIQEEYGADSFGPLDGEDELPEV
jgi:transcriptional regulator with XRE-family HTH domain